MSLSNTSLYLAYNAKIFSPGTKSNTWMVFDQNSGLIKSIGEQNAPIGDFDDDRKTDYKNLLILPGFHDAHLHMTLYGETLLQLNLKNCNSIDELKKLIAGYKLRNPDNKWIIGSGWEQDLLGRFPSADDIDEVCSNVPVMLSRNCMHIAVLNHLALDMAGINENSIAPSGSEIEKYPPDHPTKSNKPTGILKEVPILIQLQQHLPQIDSKSKSTAIKAAIGDLLKNGVTSAHTCERDSWPEFCHMSENNELPIRIFYSAFVTFKNDTVRFPRIPNDRRGTMLHFNKVKFFVDGALGPHTAALSLPYNLSNCCHGDQNGDGRGILIYTEDELERKTLEVVSEGHRLEIHVIGDRAAEVVLGVFEKINLDPKTRPVLVHCQILREDLIEKMKKRGVVASIQPQFVVSDTRSLSSNLPPALLRYAYPWKTLLNNGICCAGGSDAPVERPHPLLGIFDAVHRTIGTRDAHNRDAVFKPEECLTIEEAIQIYTQGGAHSAMMETRLGQLLPGYLADFVVLDRDIISHPEESLNAVVMETWVGGVRKWSVDRETVFNE